MMLSKYFLFKKIKALSQIASLRPHCYLSLDDIRHVLVICEASCWKSVSPCIATLKSLGKSVNVCVFIRKADKAPIWDYAYLLVEAEKDLNLWGFPNKNIKNQLNGFKVDMLLDLTGGKIPAMRYLMLQHTASFKVGAKHSSEDNIYDFSILIKEDIYDIPYFFGQIINYLQAIRSK